MIEDNAKELSQKAKENLRRNEELRRSSSKLQSAQLQRENTSLSFLYADQPIVKQ
jgi:hypothetical protein